MAIGIQTRGRLFCVRRKDGRLSTYAFRSPYRAAEHVMHAARVKWWPDLVARGVRIVAVE